MKTAKILLMCMVLVFVGCESTSKLSSPLSAVRSYNGTASVGDFVTISIDSNSQTITYKNYTNNENGTVHYTVEADGSYRISDPSGNLLSAYEVPGYMMVVEAANAGPNKDTAALLTAERARLLRSTALPDRTLTTCNFARTMAGWNSGP